MASKAPLASAKSHMERGGRPVKNNAISDRMPPMTTCQPMATYFSSDPLRSKFQRACSAADTKSSKMARRGIGHNCNPIRTGRMDRELLRTEWGLYIA